jgi:hypothetical protein
VFIHTAHHGYIIPIGGMPPPPIGGIPPPPIGGIGGGGAFCITFLRGAGFLPDDFFGADFAPFIMPNIAAIDAALPDGFRINYLLLDFDQSWISLLFRGS